jgi:glutamine amidotransferase
MIGIIDYGMGNLGSVTNAFRFLGIDATIVAQREQMQDCQALVLPGVGAFGDCMAHLQEHGFVEALREWVASDRPLLGICLGLQVLFEASEESPGIKGLGIFPGTVKRFPPSSELKIPQIGWNRVFQKQADCPMFQEIEDGSFFYLVHSYYVVPDETSLIAGETEYGQKYCSCAWKDNVFATQFHPEKSQEAGLQMLKNFYLWAEKRACL